MNSTLHDLRNIQARVQNVSTSHCDTLPLLRLFRDLRNTNTASNITAAAVTSTTSTITPAVKGEIAHYKFKVIHYLICVLLFSEPVLVPILVLSEYAKLFVCCGVHPHRWRKGSRVNCDNLNIARLVCI